MVFPADLVWGTNRAVVPLALLHSPGPGLSFTLHQCLAATHLLQEAFLHILGLDPGFFLLSREHDM